MTDRPSIRIVSKNWRVLISGDERAIELPPWSRKGLDYLLCRLFSGEDVSIPALAHYGITVRQLGDDVEIIVVPP